MSLVGKNLGRYRILHLLGKGGMGIVYLAQDMHLEQQVAVKVIRTEMNPYPDAETAEKAARLFQREARAIAKLDHPNILSLLDYGEERVGNTTLMYLVMPYRSEGSLTDWLRRNNGTESLFLQDIVQIVRQAADALQHAHNRQIIHQDVKPSNFLIRSRKERGTCPDLFLADFGIARLTTATSSMSQSVRGTPSYMAPEQWEGEPVPATDQYALAVMAYELLTGHPPFQGTPGGIMYQHIHAQPAPPSTFNPELPREIDNVILHALAKNAVRRYASVITFAHAFQLATQGIEDNSESLPATVIPPVSSIDSSTSTYTRIPGENEGGDLHVKKQPGYPTNKFNTPPPVRKRKHRSLLVAVLIALSLVVIGWSIVSAIPGAFTFLTQHLFGSSTSGSIGRTSSTGQGATNVATLTITPASQQLQNTYLIQAVTGKPDPSMNQVGGARILSSTTPSQKQTVNATGIVNAPATSAVGQLTIYNWNGSNSVTLNAGLVIPNDLSTPIHVVLDQTITIAPAPSPPNNLGIGVANIHVAETGSIGDIQSGQFRHLNGDYSTGWSTVNDYPFIKGQDAQTYTVVQQSDIDGAANALANAPSPDPQKVIQPQLQQPEQWINPPKCQRNQISDHKAGDKATSVTVTVNFICMGEAYDQNKAKTLATELLKKQAMSDFSTNYALAGNVSTTVTSATVTDTTHGTITLIVNAEGIWAFEFSDAQKQALAKLVAGKKKEEAQTLLLAQAGVKQVAVQFSGDPLPTDISRITIVVKEAVP